MEERDREPPRKRRRPALSCENCRQRKLKCDRKEPCQACVKSHMEACVYKDGQRLGRQPVVFGRSLGQSHTQPTANTSSCQPHSPAPYQVPTPTFTSSSHPSPKQLLMPFSREHDIQDQVESETVPMLDHLQPRHNDPYQRNPHALVGGLETLNTLPFEDIRGIFIKNRYYGESHWACYLHKSPCVIAGFKGISRENLGELSDVLVKSKSLARKIKFRESANDQRIEQSDAALVPSRQVADLLVHAYLRTLETMFRILDLPAFMQVYEDYWSNSTKISRNAIVNLQLVFAIGSAVCTDHNLSRRTISQWIQAAQTWLCSPGGKWRMNLDGFRAHCLLLLARQVNGIDVKVTATAAGSLSQMATHMGLHIDPDHYPQTDLVKAEREFRRRLWTASMELELQSTMDAGGVPLIRDSDYDCAPPTNLSEGLYEAGTVGSPVETTLPIEQFTPSSMQIMLAKSLPIRMKITRFINDFRAGSRYQEALALSAEFVAELRRDSILIEGYRKSGAPISTFQIEVFNLLMHRFLLALHHSFVNVARTDPTLYYSRKLCLDSALALLSPPAVERDEDFYRLILHGRSVYDDVYTQAATFLCDEICTGPADSFAPVSPTAIDGYLVIIEKHVELMLTRIEAGETNVKGYLLFSCLLAQVKATVNRDGDRESILDANKRALGIAYDALQRRLEKIPPVAGDEERLAQTDLPIGGSTLTDGSTDGLLDWFQWDETFVLPDEEDWLRGLEGIPLIDQPV